MADPYYQDDYVTLWHGDCLELADLWTCADVLVTDPPYGIPGGRLGRHEGGQVPVHPDAHWDSLDVRDAALAAWGHEKPRAVFGSPKSAHIPCRGVPLVWDKGIGPGMGDLSWPWGASYELVWVWGTGWTGPRRDSILRVQHSTGAASSIGHPTPKPTALMEHLIEYAPPGTIADPFAGSGSTGVAAKALGRKAILVELEERYCEIAARRLAQDVLNFEEPA